MSPLFSAEVLAQEAPVVARALIGAHLVHGEVVLRITETEAYYSPGDSACHAHRGRTERNAPMFMAGGHAYVYLCYGIHHLLNISCDVEGRAAAVLIRGAEPVAGHETIRARRGARPLRPELLAGPGKVTQALGVDVGLSGVSLLGGGPVALRVGRPPEGIVCGPRIGIDYADPEDVVRPLRFAEAGSPWVAQRRRLRGWTGS